MRSAQLTGNLTRKPEVVPTQGEYALIKFSIANNDESKKAQDGSYEDVVSFFDIVYWTKNPTPWLNKLDKGVGVVCDCEVKQDRWEQDGQARSRVVFSIKRGTFPIVIAGKDSAPQQQAPAQGAYAPPAKSDDSPF